MARPARFNADYYTHSADLRNDRRVKAIRTAYGAAGYGLFIMLLEALTDADNTALPIDEMEIELLAGDFGVSATDIRSLSQFGIKVGYFTTNDAGLLTCPELNSWLAPVFDKRNRSRNAAPSALLPQPVSETGVSVTVIPQSKVKESKVEHKEPMPISAAPSSASLALKAEKEKEKELDFISFWLPYYGDLPKRGSKADAKKQWLALSAATRALILTGLEAHRAEATRNGPDYLPYATTFLGQQRWKWDTFGTVSPTNALPSQPTTSAQFPMPGHELPGQVFYIAGRPGDYNMDKMAAESCLKHFPSSKVVSLAFPQMPYTMKDGNVIRG